MGCSRQSFMTLIPVNVIPSASLCLCHRWKFTTLVLTSGPFIRQLDCSRYQLKTLMSPTNSDELVCCMNFTKFVIKSHSQHSCICISILCFIICCSSMTRKCCTCYKKFIIRLRGFRPRDPSCDACKTGIGKKERE